MNKFKYLPIVVVLCLSKIVTFANDSELQRVSLPIPRMYWAEFHAASARQLNDSFRRMGVDLEAQERLMFKPMSCAIDVFATQPNIDKISNIISYFDDITSQVITEFTTISIPANELPAELNVTSITTHKKATIDEYSLVRSNEGEELLCTYGIEKFIPSAYEEYISNEQPTYYAFLPFEFEQILTGSKIETTHSVDIETKQIYVQYNADKISNEWSHNVNSTLNTSSGESMVVGSSQQRSSNRVSFTIMTSHSIMPNGWNAYSILENNSVFKQHSAGDLKPKECARFTLKYYSVPSTQFFESSKLSYFPIEKDFVSDKYLIYAVSEVVNGDDLKQNHDDYLEVSHLSLVNDLKSKQIKQGKLVLSREFSPGTSLKAGVSLDESREGTATISFQTVLRLTKSKQYNAGIVELFRPTPQNDVPVTCDLPESNVLYFESSIDLLYHNTQLLAVVYDPSVNSDKVILITGELHHD